MERTQTLRSGRLYLRSLGSGPPRDLIAEAYGLLAEIDQAKQRRSSGPPEPVSAPDSDPPYPLDDSDPIGDQLALAAAGHQ